MFPRDNIRKTFTVMHNPVFEYSNTISFASLACIILYINDKQFRCSVFTFVQCMLKYQYVLRKLVFNFEVINSGENILFDNTVIKLNPPLHENEMEKKRRGKMRH